MIYPNFTISLQIQEANAAALIWAAFQGDLEQVQDLLGKITDINAFDEVCFVGTVLIFVIFYSFLPLYYRELKNGL